jgi:hypothetical protein
MATAQKHAKHDTNSMTPQTRVDALPPLVITFGLWGTIHNSSDTKLLDIPLFINKT